MGLFDPVLQIRKKVIGFSLENVHEHQKNYLHFLIPSQEEIKPIEVWGPGSPHLCADTVFGEWVCHERMWV